MATLAIVGPTASGKSRLAMSVAADRAARDAPTEIIAIDAFTVYRGMDIGTAKPSPAERARVPHHLVDILDPWEELTVAQFQRRARRAIDEVRARGSTPLLVGGSGLYWRAVVDGLSFPPTDDATRQRIDERWGHQPAAAHAHLAEVDPAAAERIDPANVRRTIRALEVLELTGRPFSSFDDGWGRHASIYSDLEVACLEPTPEDLRAAIHRRAEQMVSDGLLQEAAGLLELGRPMSRTARQAIGYAEALAVVEGAAPVAGLADTIERRTWRFARRQRSWFRADPRCVPVPPGEARRRLADA